MVNSCIGKTSRTYAEAFEGDNGENIIIGYL